MSRIPGHIQASSVAQHGGRHAGPAGATRAQLVGRTDVPALPTVAERGVQRHARGFTLGQGGRTGARTGPARAIGRGGRADVDAASAVARILVQVMAARAAHLLAAYAGLRQARIAVIDHVSVAARGCNKGKECDKRRSHGLSVAAQSSLAEMNLSIITPGWIAGAVLTPVGARPRAVAQMVGQDRAQLEADPLERSRRIGRVQGLFEFARGLLVQAPAAQDGERVGDLPRLAPAA